MANTPSQPGALPITTLLGNEIVSLNSGPVWTTCTTAQIAGLSSGFTNDTPTSVTSGTGTTFTAAQLVTGLINRTGPVAAFTDTTDTAANLAAASAVGSGFYVFIKNGTAFTETLTGGTGVTFSSSTLVPPNSISQWLVTITSATAAVFNHVLTVSIDNQTLEVVTALSTVGAGVVTGAGVAGKIVSRSGSQTNTAFTDTTDTAANIILAQPNAHVGDSWEWSYKNGTNATATLTGGTGVTVSGITAVPAGCTARFLVTYTAAATVTIVGFSITSPSTVNGTFTANGSTAVVVAETNVTANSTISFGLKTIGGTPAGAPFLSAVTAGTGFSVKVAVGDTSVYNYLISN